MFKSSFYINSGIGARQWLGLTDSQSPMYLYAAASFLRQTDTKNNINLVCADALLLALEDVAQLRPVIPDGDLSDLNTQ